MTAVLLLAIALFSAKAGAPAADLSLAELLMLADALENKGEPERALATLQTFEGAFHEQPEYWARLARVREAKEDLAGAMAALERRDELVAPSVEDAVHQATLLWRLHRPQVALWRLQSARALARERDGGYWNLLGQLAWAEEQHALAAEAMRMAWRTQRTPEVADLLVAALEATGQPLDRLAVLADASAIDSERFLVAAIDAAVVLERWEEARRLLARGEGESRLAEQSHFWIMRATLAKHERRPQDAERDLARALALDPRSSDAHETWLQVAVQSRDPAMIRRVLEHWGAAADSDEAAWSMLAEAHTLLGDQARAAGFQARARARRQATGEPLTADEELADAVERHDRGVLEQTLRRYQGRLSLGPHVLALRELGRDDEAWALLARAGHTADPGPELIAAGLTADTIDELREQHLSGARVWGETRVTGPLELRSAGAAVELRKRVWLFGLRAQGTRLEERDWSLILARGRGEAELGAAAKLRTSVGETSARLGALVDGAGTLPQAELRQRLDWRDGAVELQAAGVWNEVADRSALLRLGGVRDGVDGEVEVRLPWHLELSSGASAGRFATRDGEPLTSELAVHGELAVRLPWKSAYLRPRAGAFRSWSPPLDRVPSGLARFSSRRRSPEDTLSLAYTNAGAGLTIGSQSEVGEGIPRGLALRYRLDAWAGLLWPGPKNSYAFEGDVGLAFARAHEVALSAFLWNDVSAAAERTLGVTLKYTLRWLL